jgi:hypothetical protein
MAMGSLVLGFVGRNLLAYVETQSQGTKVPSSSRKPILGKSKPTEKTVSWQDSVFPCHPLQKGSS